MSEMLFAISSLVFGLYVRINGGDVTAVTTVHIPAMFTERLGLKR